MRCTLFFAPLVVTAKPQRTINLHAEPLSILQELYEPGLALLVRRHRRLALSREFRLDDGGNLLKVKKRENYLLVLQVLFGGIECLDFVADLSIDRIKFHLGQVRMDSAVQENHSANIGQGIVPTQPLAIAPVR